MSLTKSDLLEIRAVIESSVRPIVEETVRETVRPIVKDVVQETVRPIVEDVVQETVRPIIEETVRPIVLSAVDEAIEPLANEVKALRNDVREIYDMIADLQSGAITDKSFQRLDIEQKLLKINAELIVAARQAGVSLPRP